jgi:hypothetical protein
MSFDVSLWDQTDFDRENWHLWDLMEKCHKVSIPDLDNAIPLFQCLNVCQAEAE